MRYWQRTTTQTAPTPYDHPYADCTSCSGTGLSSGSFSPARHACSVCADRFKRESQLFGVERAIAKQRALAIESEIRGRYDTPRAVRSTARRVKPLAAADAAWVQAYHISELNREYLHCLKVFWS